MLSEKVGRNEPCPCGSGKKFKRCCGSPSRERIQMAHQRTWSAQVSPMGVPGEAQGLVACNHFRDESDPRNVGGPNGLPGMYRVIFLFERPNYRQIKVSGSRFAIRPTAGGQDGKSCSSESEAVIPTFGFGIPAPWRVPLRCKCDLMIPASTDAPLSAHRMLERSRRVPDWGHLGGRTHTGTPSRPSYPNLV